MENQIRCGRDDDTISGVTIEVGSTPVDTDMIDAPLAGEERMCRYMTAKLIDAEVTAAAREEEIPPLMKHNQSTLRCRERVTGSIFERSISTDEIRCISELKSAVRSV